MRKNIIFLLISLFYLFYSCKEEQISFSNHDERILKLTHKIEFGECLGYCITILSIDSTQVHYIKKGWTVEDSLPTIDTSYTINREQWLRIVNSISLDSFFALENKYDESYFIDDGIVNLEITTNLRRKKIEHYYHFSIPSLDSLYRILKYIRIEL